MSFLSLCCHPIFAPLLAAIFGRSFGCFDLVVAAPYVVVLSSVSSAVVGFGAAVRELWSVTVVSYYFSRFAYGLASPLLSHA